MANEFHILRSIFPTASQQAGHWAQTMKQWDQKMESLANELHQTGWAGDTANRWFVEEHNVLQRRLQACYKALEFAEHQFPGMQNSLAQFEDQARSIADRLKTL